MTFHLGWNKPDRDTFHVGWLGVEGRDPFDVELEKTRTSGLKKSRKRRSKESTYREGQDFAERWARESEAIAAERKQAVRKAFEKVSPDLTQPLAAETKGQVAQVAAEQIADTQDLDAIVLMQEQAAELTAAIETVWFEIQEDEALALLLLSM